jgi:septum formation protein
MPFDCVAPIGVDEASVDLPPEQLVLELAKQKAESVAESVGPAIIIGSDQVGVLDGSILTKPHTMQRAEAQLKAMAGRVHQLLTGVYVLNTMSGESRQHLDCHRLTLRPLSEQQIQDYLQREQPLDCAGSYRIEGLGISLMERIEGVDFTAIVGLPLTAVTRMLEELGRPVLGLPGQ